MARENIKTRSGIAPNEQNLPFTITTSDVENYLQKKVDIINSAMVQAGNPNTPHVDVRVYTTEAGRYFVPFVVILPLDVLQNNNKKKRNDEPDIFNPKNEDKSAIMLEPYYNLFKAYIYNAEDEKAFFSDDWRRARGVARDTSPSLKMMRTPKITEMDGGRVQVVSLLIDPLRIFYDMLIMEDNRRDFKIEIPEWQKIKTGEFKYNIKRVAYTNKKNKKYKDTFAEELNRKMRGGR